MHELPGLLELTKRSWLPSWLQIPATPLLGPHGEPISWHDHYGILNRSHPGHVALLAALFLLLSWVMARYVNINTFSLHAMYRDRLIRAYLGASNPERKASRFTGFAPNDDIPMSDLNPDVGRSTWSTSPSTSWPPAGSPGSSARPSRSR